MTKIQRGVTDSKDEQECVRWRIPSRKKNKKTRKPEPYRSGEVTRSTRKVQGDTRKSGPSS